MEQPKPPLNRWLLGYILQYQQSRTRYEIDRFLLDSGYPATEIEAAWKTALSDQQQHHELFLTATERKKGFFRKRVKAFFRSGCFMFGCLPLLLLGVALVVRLIIYYNPALPEPLPDYPAATKLAFSTSLPAKLSAPDCYSMEAFEGEKFLAFVTSDAKEQVQSFYQSAAKERGFTRAETEGLYANNTDYGKGATCFSAGTTGAMFAPNKPALAVRVLSWDNVQEAGLIAQYFPQTPPKMKVILLLQGFNRRTQS